MLRITRSILQTRRRQVYLSPSTNDLIWLALTRASIPSNKQPVVLPVRMESGRMVKSLTLDREVSASVGTPKWRTHSLPYTLPVRARQWAVSPKESFKEGQQIRHNRVVPYFLHTNIETLSPKNFTRLKFLSELGDRLTAAIADPREAAFLFQRISICI